MESTCEPVFPVTGFMHPCGLHTPIDARLGKLLLAHRKIAGMNGDRGVRALSPGRRSGVNVRT